MPPQRREAGVETVWSPDNLADPDVLGKEPGKPADQRRELRFTDPRPPRIGVADRVRGYIDMGNLPDRVNARIGTAGSGESHRRAEHRRQGVIDDACDGALHILHRPAGEIRSVVGDVEA